MLTTENRWGNHEHIGRVDMFVELRIEVSMDVKIHIEVFWVMTPCRSHFYYEDRGSRFLQNSGNACLTAHCYNPEDHNTICMKSSIFSGVTPRSLVKVCCHFGGTYCLHNQGQRVSQASPEDGGSVFFETWVASTRLHGVTSQKIVLSIVTAMTVSDLTDCWIDSL
jgi:hypothetical protein